MLRKKSRGGDDFALRLCIKIQSQNLNLQYRERQLIAKWVRVPSVQSTGMPSTVKKPILLSLPIKKRFREKPIRSCAE